jgi:AraC-like DNA-binding protein
MVHAFTLRRYLELMQARGFAAADVLAGTGIDVGRIADKGYVIEAQQRQAMIANMIRLTGNPALGFEFGRDMRISQLGVVGHLLMSSPSISEQTQVWLQLAGPLLGIQSTVMLRKEAGGGWTASFHEPTPPGPEHVFCVEEVMMISGRIAQTLNGEWMRMRVLRLDYPEPPHAQLYRDTFGCDVEFDAGRWEYSVDSPTADQIFGGADEEFAVACRQYGERLLQEIATPPSMRARLRDLLSSSLPRLPTIEEAARSLGMSERTLRRRLDDEGTGFQEVITDLRRDLAIEYLRGQRMKPKEIGYLLGFTFPGDFHRAFRAWTGRSVSEFVEDDAEG